LTNLLNLFWNNLLPIFILAAAGFLVGKWKGIEARPLSQLVFYIFSPALVFDLISHSDITFNLILRIGLITFGVAGILAVLAYGIGRSLKLERKLLAATVMVAVLPNAGNYGLSLNLFAFGEEALSYASVYFAFSVIMTFTLGVVIASLGTASLKNSLLSLLKVPSIYAVALGFIFLAYNLQFPSPIDRSIRLLSDATVPAMLILLGLQFQNLTRNYHLKALTLASSLKLIISPILGFGLASLMGLQGAAFNAVVTETAMPSAVTSTVLATQYGVEPSFVASVVFYTTILSPLTVTPILALLG
jgi:malate permease and related proteins